jgi:hypothetical protein
MLLGETVAAAATGYGLKMEYASVAAAADTGSGFKMEYASVAGTASMRDFTLPLAAAAAT